MAVDGRHEVGGRASAEAGLEHLRAAAREAIEAARALLDAAESALEDPDLGRQLADSVRAVVEMAGALRADPRAEGEPSGAPPAPDARGGRASSRLTNIEVG